MKVGPDQHKDSEIPFTNPFGLSIEDLCRIPEKYMKRKLDDDIEAIQLLGGTDEILKKLRTNKDTGLSQSDDLLEREKAFGSNHPKVQKQNTYCEICWETLKDLTLRILIISGIVSMILGGSLGDHKAYGWIEGFAIIVAVVVVVNVTAVNDMQKQKKFLDLQEQNRKIKIVTRLREGTWKSVHPRELLVGDIVKLENGIIIPADGVLLEAYHVETLEATMTGENDNIKKVSFGEALLAREEFFQMNPALRDLGFEEDRHHDVPSPVVLSGTNLAEGFGTMVVVAVGKNSCEGRIVELAEQEEEATPLMKKLDSLAESIGKCGLAAAVITVIAIFLRIIIERSTRGEWDDGNPAQDFVDAFIIGITVLVVAIPEGLPLAVTISLAYSVKKMQKDNNLVRKMHACETMGGANMICSDKTGTLTQNKMTVSEFWAGGSLVSFERTRISHQTFQAEYLHLLKESIFTNSSAYIDSSGGEVGSKTEIAMLLLMQSLGHTDYVETRKIYEARPFKPFPFSSKRKRSSIQISLENGSKRLHVKGASEVIAEKCDYFLNAEGKLQEMTRDELGNVEKVIENMTERALRVIALAYKDLQTDFDLEQVDDLGFPMVENNGLTLIGLAGIRDPIRDEVPEAVRKCQRAGITVRMVTGDNKATARAIAKECFIISSENHIVMEGKEFSIRTGGTVCKKCQVKDCDCPRTKAEAKKVDKKIRKDVVKNFESFK
jgi:Ca2+ transporting ATPase